LTRVEAGPIFTPTGADVRRASYVENLAMAEFPAPQSASALSTAPVTAGVLAYLLYGLAAVSTILSSGLPLIAPLAGLFGIAGLIVCYVKRSDAAGTWVASHFTWLIRTFWWSLAWAILGWLVMLTLGLILVGIPIAIAIWFVAGVWVIYRVIRGYLSFKDSRAIPGIA
jgi:uncharacterized membrane protein